MGWDWLRRALGQTQAAAPSMDGNDRLAICTQG
jgi:hypothetical protein